MGAHHHHHHHGESCAHDAGSALGLGLLLNAAFVVVEIGFGLHAQSLALLADAGHNAGDVLALFLSWCALRLTRRPPTARFTYGLQGSSILSALANAMILLVATGAIGWESILRLIHPAPVAGLTVSVVAALGVLANGGTALLLMRRRHDDLNTRAAFAHMAADAATSLTVVAAGVIIYFTGWVRLDPLAGLIMAGLIVAGTWRLLRDSLAMALAAVPPGIDPEGVRAHLAALPGVTNVHDLHIWPMSTTETALTAHLVMADYPGRAFITDACASLRTKHGIGHATLQIEAGTTAVADCALSDHAAA